MLIFCYFSLLFYLLLFAFSSFPSSCGDFRLSFFSVLPQVAGLQICHLPHFFFSSRILIFVLINLFKYKFVDLVVRFLF